MTRVPSFPSLARFTCFLFALWLVGLSFCGFRTRVVFVFFEFLCLFHLVLLQSTNRYSTKKGTIFHELGKIALMCLLFLSEKDTVRRRAQKRPAARKRESWCQLRKRAEELARQKNQRMKTPSRERKVSGLLRRDHKDVVWRDVKCLLEALIVLDLTFEVGLMLIFINVSLCPPLTKLFRSATWRPLCCHGWRTFVVVLWSSSKQPSVFER